ncbi:MAG: S53 family peptidase [Actinoallomurus sp.]
MTPDPAVLGSAASATAPATPLPGHMAPLWRRAQPKGVTPNSIGEPGGYDPVALRAYLGLNGTGKGQTVAIVEAWDVRTAVLDATAKYDAWYGLKPACSDTVTSDCFKLTITAPAGTRTPTTNDELGANASFQLESDMDVQIVHAIAPDAAITVVEGYDDSIDSLMAAVDYATSLHPAAISNSWGAAEFADEQAYDGHCKDALCVFASGDSGNPGAYPAASPSVLAVGGTTLDAGPAGQVRSETAWEGSGGGISPYEPQPDYQSAADPYHTGRGVPDVSFDADPNSGVASYVVLDFPQLSFHYEIWTEIGGTSVGAPAWSAILAVADQERAAHGRPPLTTDDVHAVGYAKSPKGLADITTGVNGVCGAICTANLGYDLVTGKGSPRPRIDTYLARH